MADLMVGGAFLGSFLNVLFDKLASPEVVNFIRGKKLDSDLIGRLEITLIAVRAVLNDAEQKQIRDSDVNHWLNHLKDAVYVADDLLDEISTKAVTQKKKVRYSVSRLFNLQDRKMVSELEDIVERLESVLKVKKHLDLKKIAVENLSYKTPSTSLQDRSHVYGRDKDKEAIIQLLLDDIGDGGDEVSVIPIVGMGGVGKTTLARLVYNDDKLKKIFNLQAWVCVSEEFDILKVTKIIAEEVTGSTCRMDNLNSLLNGLQDSLKEKKFLIVLDDAWIEDLDTWKDLKKPFHAGVRGSKILVTTRSKKVASAVTEVPAYDLNQLSDEDCWLVFADHACFSPGPSGDTAGLENIGREIVQKKCRGQPLAAQSLGGILRGKHDIRDWENLLNSDIWELSESESKIIPALRVSYHYLPPHLKRCFVYCSLYPKDYKFVKKDLILLWMAEDLLPPPRKGKTLEEVGGEYFDYLVARSFLRRSSNPWQEESFVMHDLLHDLTVFLGGEFYFRSEDLEVKSKISVKTRHLSFTKSSGLLKNFEVLGTANFLRTFLPMSSVFYFYLFNDDGKFNEDGKFNDDGKAACTVLSKLKHLRVLSFWRFEGLNALPDSIGELIHLRYLDLSETSIMALPKSLGNLHNLQTLKLLRCNKLNVLPISMQNLVNLLYLDLSRTSIMALPESLGNLNNLQTLKLSSCDKLTVLPSSMQNLVKLLYLDISGTALKEMPQGMRKLTYLRQLSYYIVGKHEENGIKELGGLSNLHNSLSIEELENVSNGSEALEAKIKDKKHISQLSLIWSSTDYCFNTQTDMDILCKLQPHQDLQRLKIKGYRGTEFPDWVGNSSYRNMTDIKLSSCKNCFMLPSLGQLPSLKKLSISYLDALVTINDSFYMNNDSSLLRPFPFLESLIFKNMPFWEGWCSSEPYAFLKLKCLKIENCPKLRGLPNHLPALEELTIIRCTELASSLPKGGLHAPSMPSFIVSHCDMLKSLPQQMNTLLPKLRYLCIENCPEIESFPEGGMPPSLRSIDITNCEKLLSGPAWPSMGMLTHVSIEGPCDGIKSFPKEGLLPSSLTSLKLRSFSSLETLDCKGLLHLTSLQSLRIDSCPKLENMAGERPPRIKIFTSACPLLNEQGLCSIFSNDDNACCLM